MPNQTVSCFAAIVSDSGYLRVNSLAASNYHDIEANYFGLWITQEEKFLFT